MCRAKNTHVFREVRHLGPLVLQTRFIVELCGLDTFI